MCGITGILGRKTDKKTLKRMCDTINHRGPDDRAYFTDSNFGMGMCRLSIVDLRKGIYPLQNEDKTLSVIYNGEIYNFAEVKKELQKKGHKFRTKNDGEIIPHAYEEWGADCVRKFNGMFAIALWDSKKKQLFLARDRLGIKPLYYYWDGSTLVFGSEIKAILKAGIKAELNMKGFADYFTFQNYVYDHTLFKNVKSLLPGYCALVGHGNLKISQYWDVHFKYSSSSEAECTKEYLNHLKKSVGLQLMSDVPVGSHLSGGMDTSSVVVIASKLLGKKRLHTFSGAFPGGEDFDERKYARQVVKIAGTNQHEILIKPSDFKQVMEKVVWHLDQPRASDGAFPQYMLSKLVSKHVKVTLTGHGGDETFAGYAKNGPAYLLDLMKVQPIAAMKYLHAYLNHPQFKMFIKESIANRNFFKYSQGIFFSEDEKENLFSEKTKNQIAGYDSFEGVDNLLRKSDAKTEFDKRLYLDIKMYLPLLLAVEDKMSMAHSVEGRVPILDHELVEFSATVPFYYKVKGTRLKNIIRNGVEGILPRDVIDHKKMGFSTPLGIWFRTSLKDYVKGIILSKRALGRGYFNPEYVKMLVNEHMSGKKDRKQQLWMLLCFELWCRKYLDD